MLLVKSFFFLPVLIFFQVNLNKYYKYLDLYLKSPIALEYNIKPVLLDYKKEEVMLEYKENQCNNIYNECDDKLRKDYENYNLKYQQYINQMNYNSYLSNCNQDSYNGYNNNYCNYQSSYCNYETITQLSY